MSKKSMKPVATAIGAAMAGALTIGTANAAENPFGLSDIGSGYTQLASSHGGEMKDKEGKCGEGKCGGDMKDKEGKCGGEMKGKEGKCGEGKCGGNK
jgi:uncharacterized low-complexity protein